LGFIRQLYVFTCAILLTIDQLDWVGFDWVGLFLGGVEGLEANRLWTTAPLNKRSQGFMRLKATSRGRNWNG